MLALQQRRAENKPDLLYNFAWSQVSLKDSPCPLLGSKSQTKKTILASLPQFHLE